MLIIFILPMIFIAIAIKIEDRGPILYKSKRVGKKLKIIKKLELFLEIHQKAILEE